MPPRIINDENLMQRKKRKNSHQAEVLGKKKPNRIKVIQKKAKYGFIKNWYVHI